MQVLNRIPAPKWCCVPHARGDEPHLAPWPPSLRSLRRWGSTGFAAAQFGQQHAFPTPVGMNRLLRVLLTSRRGKPHVGDELITTGISLFVVLADTPGVNVKNYRTIDGQRAATVQFSHAALRTCWRRRPTMASACFVRKLCKRLTMIELTLCDVEHHR